MTAHRLDFDAELMALAAFLPSGLDDPKAAEKLAREQAELTEAVEQRDRVGALLEAADVYYYVQKSIYNHLLTPADGQTILAIAGALAGVSQETIRDAAIAKYVMRARPGNPKDDRAERDAVGRLLLAPWDPGRAP